MRNRAARWLASGAAPTIDPSTPPAAGEATGAQRGSGGFGSLFAGDQLGAAPDAGTFETYRRMRANPTLALVGIVETSPIRSTNWSVNIPHRVSERVDSQGSTLDLVEMESFINQAVMPLVDGIVAEMTRSFDYGFSAFEKVFEVRRLNGAQRIVYRKIKPLMVDITNVVVDEKDGSFRGVQNNDVVIAPEKSLWLTYDGEPGNEWYGRSKFENIRLSNVLAMWDQVFTRMGRYASRLAGPTPIIEYPEGTSIDGAGAERSNYDIALGVLHKLEHGRGVTMPNTLAKFAQEFANRGTDISKLKSWSIDFIEPNGSYGTDFTGMMSYMDKLLARGRLVPERTVFEGQHGTLAEAAVHGDVVLSAAEQFTSDVARCLNHYVVDPLLAYNYGADAVGSVVLTPEPIIDEKRRTLKEMTIALLTSPTMAGSVGRIFDLDAALETLGAPLVNVDDREEVPDVEPVDDPPEDDPEMITRAALSVIRAKRAAIVLGR